jgi:hypothetical protein
MKEDFGENTTKEKEERASRLMAQLGEETKNAVEEGALPLRQCPLLAAPVQPSPLFWSLACSAAVHINNRLPTSSNTMSASPYSVYYGRTPSVSQLRSWACVVCVKLEKPKSRLHSKSI